MLVVGLVVSRQDCDLSACVDRHEAAAVSDVDHVGHVIDYHDNGRTGSRPLRADLLARHGVLSPRLGHLDQVYETPFALLETANDRLLCILGEVLILDDVVVEVIPEVVGAGRAAVAVKNSKEAYLRPVYV